MPGVAHPRNLTQSPWTCVGETTSVFVALQRNMMLSIGPRESGCVVLDYVYRLGLFALPRLGSVPRRRYQRSKNTSNLAGRRKPMLF